MKIATNCPQFLDKKALIVVSAKEEGVIYKAANGVLEELDHVEEHPPRHSDNEGFFFRSAKGTPLGSGAPLEVDKQENIDTYMKSIAAELQAVIKQEKPNVIFLFEPEHLKGRILHAMENNIKVPVHTVRHGNYVHEHGEKLMQYLAKYTEEAKVDLDAHDYETDLKKF